MFLRWLQPQRQAEARHGRRFTLGVRGLLLTGKKLAQVRIDWKDPEFGAADWLAIRDPEYM